MGTPPSAAQAEELRRLRDDARSDPAVLDFLRAENRRVAAWQQPRRVVLGRLRAELEARIPGADEGTPLRRGDWLYWWRELPGQDHPRYLRRPAAGGAEELLLDTQRRAAGHPGYDLGTLAVSPDGRWLAVSEDWLGNGLYSLRIRDLQRRRWLPGCIENADADIVWAADSRQLLYVRKQPRTLAAREIWLHRRGRPAAADRCLYRLQDSAFHLGMHATHARRHVVIHAEATRRSRLLLLDAAAPERPPRAPVWPAVVAAAGDAVRLAYDEDEQHAWLLSDAGAPDFALWRATRDPQQAQDWHCVVPHQPGVVLEDFLPLPGERLLLVERRHAQLGLRLLDLGAGGERSERSLFEPDGLSALSLDDNPEPDATAIRVRRDRLDRPGELLSLDFASGQLSLLKRDPLAGPFDADAYEQRRCWVEAADGARIPVSLLARREVLQAGAAPVWLYGYGAYGDCLDPVFDADRLSLLDRGVIHVTAHVRGGGELGTAWHDHGRLAAKPNSFSDFQCVAKALVARGLADPARIFAHGASAGGLLVAAALNLDPGRYCGALLEVPFVDVLDSMSDPELPLTELEYEEWGDPRDPAQRAAIAAWSPLQQLNAEAARRWPPILATAGLHDAQVAYWEPARYLRRLQQLGAPGPLLLHTELGAGHQGHSGRFSALHDTAQAQAFGLWCLRCL